MLRAVVPEISAIKAAEHDAVGPQKARPPDLTCVGPARRAVCGHLLSFLCPPDRQHDRDADSGEPAACGDAGPLDEYFWRVGVELEPPDEESKRLIDRPAPDHEPGGPELRLVGETPGRPLGRRPNKGEHDDRDKEQLPPENLGRGHRPRSARPVHPRNDNIQAIAVARAVAQRSAGQSERSRLRPKLQSTPPGPAMPLTCLPSSRSRDGIQGTSWKPRPLSIIANRPEASDSLRR